MRERERERERELVKREERLRLRFHYLHSILSKLGIIVVFIEIAHLHQIRTVFVDPFHGLSESLVACLLGILLCHHQSFVERLLGQLFHVLDWQSLDDGK